jgi:hypothetical protein
MSPSERTNTLTGTWKNGQVILDSPADWPDGCRVIVEPIPDEAETLGITEQLWPQSPEAIKKWLAWFDSIEPIETTAEEEAQWQAAREAQRAYEIAKFEERARRIGALFP